MDKELLKPILQAISLMKQGLHHLDRLELEILQIKTGFRSQIDILVNHICQLFGVNIYDCELNESYYSAPTDNLIQPLQNESNGYQEIVSQPLSTKKSVEEIIKEIKEMIIELKIKGSVRERPN